MQWCLVQLADLDLSDITIVSPVAGYTITSIEKIIWKQNHIIRIMPNLGVKYKKWLIAYTENHIWRNNIKELLWNLGLVIELPENKFDEFTGIFGSGPGFFLEILWVWYRRGMSIWMGTHTSMEVLMVFLDSVKDHLLENKDIPIDTLVREIATKWWTTEAGINTFHKLLIGEGLDRVIQSSIEKCRNLW
jgi:pyrroline-5-carboxylate reductase